MNFQPSVIIWTVICFCLLMLILKNLLFKPVLAMLDSRQEKISASQLKKAEIEKLKAENEKQLAEQKELEAERLNRLAKEKAAQIQLDGKKEIEAAQRKCLDDVKKYREGITDEYEQIVSSVAPKMETAAAIFAKNIITHRV